MKKIISIILSIVMMLSVVNVSSFALSDKKIVRGNVGSGNPNSYKLNNTLVSDLPSTGVQLQSVLPSSFDSRNSSYLSSVKNQGNYGNCWSHASMACAETYAIKNLGFPITTDFSEMQNAYFTYSTPYDKYGLLAGDSTSIVSPDFNYATIGGNIYMNTFSQARWQGVVYDSLCPQDTKNYTAPNYGSEYAYSKDTLHLTDAQWLNMADVSTVKQMVMEYGIGSTAYFSDDVSFDDTLLNYYKSNYSADESGTNHAVCLVGWDDNYSRNNFTGASKPTKNGAWILKNSWGTDVGDKGYFYISYEDISLKAAPVAFYKYAQVKAYENIYQYDGSSNFSYLYYEDASSAYEANVFTAQDSTNLESIGYYSNSNAEKYSVMIYTGVGSSPTTGTLALTDSGVSTYAGYHTIKLSKLIPLTKSQKFSVVIKKTTTDGSDATFYEDVSSNTDGIFKFVNTAKAGQSYMSYNGKNWQDLSANGENIRIKAFTTHNHDFTSETKQATCTEDGKITKTCKICGQTEYITIPKLGHNFSTSVVTKSATCTQEGIRTYYCSRCNVTKTETISALGHNYEELVVAPTCTEQGYTIFTCTRGDDSYKDNYTDALGHQTITDISKATLSSNGKAVTSCTVCGEIISSSIIYSPKTFNLSSGAFVYDGKIKTPSVTVYGSDGEEISSDNYTLSFDSGRTDVGKYAVTVTFKGEYYSGSKTLYFSILPKNSTAINGKINTESIIKPVNVKLYQGETLISTETVSANSDGIFVFNNLSTGTYSIKIGCAGSLIFQVKNISVGSGTVTDLTVSSVEELRLIEIINGDANSDGTVNVSDIASLLLNVTYGQSFVEDIPEDIDGNGVVNVSDVAIILLETNYGKSSSLVNYAK